MQVRVKCEPVGVEVYRRNKNSGNACISLSKLNSGIISCRPTIPLNSPQTLACNEKCLLVLRLYYRRYEEYYFQH